MLSFEIREVTPSRSKQSNISYVLLAGVSEFGDFHPPLPGAVRDLSTVHLELSNEKYGDFQVESLLVNPTREALRQGLLALQATIEHEQSVQNDTLAPTILLYLATHGLYTEQQFALVLHPENTATSPSILLFEELKTWLQPLSTYPITLILDCCRRKANQQGTGETPHTREDIALHGNNWAVLTSAGPGQASWELPASLYDTDTTTGPHGLFTQALLEEWRTPTHSSSREIRIKSLYEGVRTRVKKQTHLHTLPSQQEPMLYVSHYECGEVVLGQRPTLSLQDSLNTLAESLRFQPIQHDDKRTPEAGEMHLRVLHDRGKDRRDLCRYLLRYGLNDFVQGEKPIQHVVVQTRPTLDDMLAATCAVALSLGQTIPSGMNAFAEYAAIAREGLFLPTLPLEESLDGVYLALCQEHGELDTPERCQNFLLRWKQLASLIWKAAQDNMDPRNQSLFQNQTSFYKETLFLRKDKQVFLDDVRHGERWKVKLPGSFREEQGLLLRNPRSILFKHWSRDDNFQELQGGHRFLAVWNEPSMWVFSTDPLYRLSLLDLFQQLESAEREVVGNNTSTPLWFDGAPFGNTMLASPWQGSCLPSERILHIVKQWLSVQLMIQEAVKG